LQLFITLHRAVIVLRNEVFVPDERLIAFHALLSLLLLARLLHRLGYRLQGFLLAGPILVLREESTDSLARLSNHEVPGLECNRALLGDSGGAKLGLALAVEEGEGLREQCEPAFLAQVNTLVVNPVPKFLNLLSHIFYAII
jgi:hypothetical protein